MNDRMIKHQNRTDIRGGKKLLVTLLLIVYLVGIVPPVVGLASKELDDFNDPAWEYVGRKEFYTNTYRSFDDRRSNLTFLFKGLEGEYKMNSDSNYNEPTYKYLKEGLHFIKTLSGHYDNEKARGYPHYCEEATLLKSFNLDEYDVKLKPVVDTIKYTKDTWPYLEHPPYSVPTFELFINNRKVFNYIYSGINNERTARTTSYIDFMDSLNQTYKTFEKISRINVVGVGWYDYGRNILRYHWPSEGVIINARDSFYLTLNTGTTSGNPIQARAELDIWIRKTKNENKALDMKINDIEAEGRNIKISQTILEPQKAGFIPASKQIRDEDYPDLYVQDVGLGGLAMPYMTDFINRNGIITKKFLNNDFSFDLSTLNPIEIKEIGFVLSNNKNMVNIEYGTKQYKKIKKTHDVYESSTVQDETFETEFKNLIMNQTYYIKPYVLYDELYLDTNENSYNQYYLDYENLYKRETVIYGDIIEVKLRHNVFEILKDKVLENIIPDYGHDARFVVAQTHAPVEIDEEDDIENAPLYNQSLSSRDLNPVFIGQGQYEGAVRDLHLNNFEAPAGQDNFMKANESWSGKLVSYIRSFLNTTENDSTLFTARAEGTSDSINYQYLFDDYEKDFKGFTGADKLNAIVNSTTGEPKDFKVRYKHDPSIFDNPVAEDSRSDKWKVVESLADPYVINKASVDLRGKWDVEIQASDDTGNANFDKYSPIAQASFIIHQAPIAEIHYVIEDGNYLLTSEFSYDPDFQYSLPEQGIEKVKWEYRLKDSPDFREFSDKIRVLMPTQIGNQEVDEIALTVWDSQGASTTTKKMVEITQGMLWANLDTERADLSIKSVPASEKLEVTNIKSLPKAPGRLAFGFRDNLPLYNGSTFTAGAVESRTLTSNNDVKEKDVLTYFWNDIKGYTINPRIKDGTYKMQLAGKPDSDWSDYLVEWDVNIDTPVDLEVKAENRLESVIGESENQLRVSTSRYVDKVNIYLGSSKNSKDYKVPVSRQTNNTITIGDKKNWDIVFNPESRSDGTYWLTVEAVTTNGNVEMESWEVLFQNISLFDFRIESIVNHPEGEFGISYPLRKNENSLPFEAYKTGYYAKFRIDSIGDPNLVTARVYVDGNHDKDLNFTKIGQDGNIQHWEASYYSNANLESGRIYVKDIKAQKGIGDYNYNDKESWDGHSLTIDGTAYQDGIINRNH